MFKSASAAPGTAAACGEGDLAAILGELLANAVKNADVGGSVAVSAARKRGSGAEGYGLGLAIVRRRAEALGGSVSCESDPGRLTTFTLELPAG